MRSLTAGLIAAWLATVHALTRPPGDDDPERGDVPGWVMVTVMSAILVVAILGVFEPQIKTAIGHALDTVTNSK
jgi:hypothetical protein